MGRFRCLHQIGMVHHWRLRDAFERNEPANVLLRHAQAAEEYYQRGVRLCPKDAFTELAPMHNQFGILYDEVGQFDKAREHFEMGVFYDEKIGNRFGAGNARSNMARMYARASEMENSSSKKHDCLLRAHAYATAALRDFEHYQGRATEMVADAQHVLDLINQAIAKLPL